MRNCHVIVRNFYVIVRNSNILEHNSHLIVRNRHAIVRNSRLIDVLNTNKNLYLRIMGIWGAGLVEVGGCRQALYGVPSWGILGRRSSWYSVMITLAHFGKVPPMGIHILTLLRSPSLTHHPFQAWNTPRSSFYHAHLIHEIQKFHRWCHSRITPSIFTLLKFKYAGSSPPEFFILP